MSFLVSNSLFPNLQALAAAAVAVVADRLLPAEADANVIASLSVARTEMASASMDRFVKFDVWAQLTLSALH